MKALPVWRRVYYQRGDRRRPYPQPAKPLWLSDHVNQLAAQTVFQVEMVLFALPKIKLN